MPNSNPMQIQAEPQTLERSGRAPTPAPVSAPAKKDDVDLLKEISARVHQALPDVNCGKVKMGQRQALECTSEKRDSWAYTHIYAGPIAELQGEVTGNEKPNGFGYMVRYLKPDETLWIYENSDILYAHNHDESDKEKMYLEQDYGFAQFAEGGMDPALAEKTAYLATQVLTDQLQDPELQSILTAATRIQGAWFFEDTGINAKDAGILYSRLRARDVYGKSEYFSPSINIGGFLPGYNTRAIQCHVKSPNEVDCHGSIINLREEIPAEASCRTEIEQIWLNGCRVKSDVDSVISQLRGLALCTIQARPQENDSGASYDYSECGGTVNPFARH